MSGSFCHELLQNLRFHLEEMRPSYVANCVINGFSSYTAIMLNCVTIYAITKTSSLPKPLKTLLLSLAVSDLGVGSLVQPFYIALIINLLQENNRNCTTFTAFAIFISLVFFNILLRCVVANCWQILGYPPSSQIPGTCDSQSCCCCSGLNRGFWFLSFISCPLDITVNYFWPNQYFLFRNYSIS